MCFFGLASQPLLNPACGESQQVAAISSTLRGERNLDDFYTKVVDVEGILVLGSPKASDEALLEARYLIGSMLATAPEVHSALAAGDLRVAVMAPTELTTDVPEHGDLKPKAYWDRRARGLGGTEEIPVTSCGEENLLEYDGDPYRGENILIHEFAHSVHLVGMPRVDPDFDARLRSTFEHAKSQGLWKGTYAETNHEEYFAEGTQSWFNCNAPPGGVHGSIRTRDALRAYDPGLAQRLIEVYGDNPWLHVPPSDRAGHTASGAGGVRAERKFAWPESLKELKQEPQGRGD